MASRVVVDSGVLLATVLDEPLSAKAEALLKSWAARSFVMVAPTLCQYEIIAAMRKHAYRGTQSTADALRGRDIVLSYPVQYMIDDDLLRRGYDLATQYNRPTAYDSQYLAVAERLQCEFWTADERLYNALNQELTWIRWLGNFAA